MSLLSKNFILNCTTSVCVVKRITGKVNQFEVVCYFKCVEPAILTAMIEKDQATLTQTLIFNSTFHEIIVSQNITVPQSGQ